MGRQPKEAAACPASTPASSAAGSPASRPEDCGRKSCWPRAHLHAQLLAGPAVKHTPVGGVGVCRRRGSLHSAVRQTGQQKAGTQTRRQSGHARCMQDSCHTRLAPSPKNLPRSGTASLPRFEPIPQMLRVLCCAELTSVAKKPTDSTPQAPQKKCTGAASTGSSTFSLQCR